MTAHTPEPNCLNCGAELHGPFCHACGQKAVPQHLGLHDFVHEAGHEFLHFDGKILNSLTLLILKPGLLTQEFVAGRRARYVTPLRLYLTFSVIFFALAAIVPNAGIIRVGPTKASQGKPITAGEERAIERISTSLEHNIPRVMFVLMPAFGFLTWLFYRRTQPYYIPHLYYSVHFHAFVFLVLSIVVLCSLGGPTGKQLGSILLLVTLPYHFIALRRVYDGSRKMTFVKGTAVGVLYLLLLAGAMALIAWMALETLPAQGGVSSNARPTTDGSTLRSRYSHTASASG